MKLARAIIAMFGGIAGLVICFESGDGGAYALAGGALFLIAGTNFEAWCDE